MHYALSQHCVHSALFSRDGRGVVMSRSATNLLKAFEVTPSLRVTLIGGFLVPGSRLLEIFFHALSAFVADAENTLRRCMIPVGGFLVPRDRLPEILLHALSVLVAEAEVTLRGSIPIVGGFSVPRGRLLEILFHALSALVAKTEVMLRGSIPIVGGFLVPEDRLLEILLHARSRSRSQGYTALARELRQLQLSVPSMMRPACPARGAFF